MKPRRITSPANPIIKEAMRVKKNRARYGHGAFLIEGQHLVEVAMASPNAEIRRVFVTDEFLAKGEGQILLRELSKRKV